MPIRIQLGQPRPGGVQFGRSVSIRKLRRLVHPIHLVQSVCAQLSNIGRGHLNDFTRRLGPGSSVKTLGSWLPLRETPLPAGDENE